MICQEVADRIKGKTPNDILKKFNIKNDFTPEKEENIPKENTWAVFEWFYNTSVILNFFLFFLNFRIVKI